MPARKIENRGDQGRSPIIAGDIRKMRDAEFRRDFGHAGLIADEQHLDILQLQPGTDRVALDRVDVGIGEGLGGGEEG